MIGALSMNVANDKCLRKPCREIVRVENTPGNLGIDGKRVKVKVKSPRYRPGMAQRVPGGLGSQIFMTFGT